MGHYIYRRWDGSQEINPVGADELMEAMAEDLIADGDLPSALQRLWRWGGEPRPGERMPGLQELLERLKQRRQEQLSRYNLGSILDDIGRALEEIVQKERAGIQRRLDESGTTTNDERRTTNDEGPVGEMPGQPDAGPAEQVGAERPTPDPTLREMLEKIAARKREFLDRLPEEPGGRITALSDYEFMDEGARQQFQQLLQMLQQRVMENYFQGLKQSIQRLTQQDLARIRDMLRDLNKLFQERRQGGEPDFEQFMQQYGDLFPPGIKSLEELAQHLQRQMAQMQSLLDSMPRELRQQLRDMMDALLQDDRIKWEMAQLAANLEQLVPMRGLRRQYPFQGEESLTLDEAMRLMERLQRMDKLERQLNRTRSADDLEQIDPNQVGELIGEDARQQLEQLQQLVQQLEAAGYIQRQGNSWELTPRGVRRIGQKALQDIFARLKKEGFGEHQTTTGGAGSERIDESKPYEFGDPFLLDIQKTLMNSLVREGAGTPIRLQPGDFEVYRTEYQTQSSIVLALDMSRSMLLRGCFVAAKKVAIALNSLIRSQFPRDNLYVVVFSSNAQEIKPESLPALAWDDYVYGTNMQHAFMLSRQLLARHKAGTRQIILITDGEPTAHLENGRIQFAYPPTYRTIQETLREVVRCTREQILINTFMLERSPYLLSFIDQMTKINKGRAFFAAPERLGEYILVDYVSSKKKMLR